MSARSNSQFVMASVTEFLSVWALGGEASLNLTTNKGLATVGFNCTLGHPGASHSIPAFFPPPSPPTPSPPSRPRHRGPAEKEKNRLRAARHQAAQVKDSSPESSAPVTPPSTSVPVTINVPGESPVENFPKSVISESSETDEGHVEVASKSIHSDSPNVSLVCENTKCEQCGFNSKSGRGLKVHIRSQHRISQIDGADDIIDESKSIATQTEETCSYCKDEIESLEKHNVSGFCPKNNEAQRLVLYQLYGQHHASPGQGFPAWMINQPRVQY